MNDIVLLITGVLTTRQPSLSVLPKQPEIQLDSGVKRSKNGQSFQLNSSVKITSNEFVKLDKSSKSTPLTLQPEHQKTLLSKTQKNHIQDFYSLSEVKNPQAFKVRFPHEQRLISQQNYDNEIVPITPRFDNQNLPNLRFGSSGLAVRVLQRLLVANGYTMRVDGIFGAFTESAVKAFQNRRNLGSDGVVGQRTWQSLTR